MLKLSLRILLFGFLVLILQTPGNAQMPGLQDITADTDCFSCHSDASISRDLPGGHKLSLMMDKNKWKKSKHFGLGCSACHGDKPHPPSDQISTKEGWEDFKNGLRASCAGCHPDVQEAFGKSAHAMSSSEKAPKSCVNCHNPHEQGISVKSKKDTIKLCSGCHEMPTETYFESVHGQNLLLGDEESATCLDCHGYHAVMKPENVSDKDLATVCRKCHKDATAKAVDGWFSHTPITPVQRIMMSLANLFYAVVIPLTILGMVTHQIMKHRRTAERRRADR